MLAIGNSALLSKIPFFPYIRNIRICGAIGLPAGIPVPGPVPNMGPDKISVNILAPAFCDGQSPEEAVLGPKE